MDELITRIVEIERQSSDNVRQAESESAERIAAFRRSLDERMIRERERIAAEENARFAAAVAEAKKRADAEADSAKSASEHLFRNPDLLKAVKEDIVVLLLERGGR